jgi:hypothetical protein
MRFRAGNSLAYTYYMTECDLWAGPTNSQGYGIMKVKYDGVWHTKNAHRAIYEAYNSIADGLVVDHLCRNRLCIRVDHLEAVSNHENVLRGNSGKHMAQRTHCPKGHEYTADNTIALKNGSRECRQCRSSWRRNYYLKYAK